jgi:DNA-binding NtrC family response regulator
MAQILLIDDDAELSRLLQLALEECGHMVEGLDSAGGGLELVETGRFDVVLLDNKMPGMTGREFLSALRSRGQRVPVILMTGHTSAELAIEAWRLQAFAYVTKPMQIDRLSGELLQRIDEAVKTARVIKDPIQVPAEGELEGGEAELLGNSECMHAVYRLVGQWADTPDPVLVVGETGTGKELVARALYQHSSRAGRPFVAINTAAIPESTLESELFGHEKGAFTGAEQRYLGKFEQANGGTILLDEIGDMSLIAQAKILRVLQERKITRLKGSAAIPVDFRVIASTHRDLESMVEAGAFRRDLYHRLNGVTIPLPPLRERGGDVPQLADHFLHQEAQRLGQPPRPLHEDALACLQRYSWPGNVRELHKVIRRAVRVCRGPKILPEDLGLMPPAPSGGDDVLSHIRAAVRAAWQSDQGELDAYLGKILERELLQLAWTESGANESEVARRLGIARNTVRSRIQRDNLK